MNKECIILVIIRIALSLACLLFGLVSVAILVALGLFIRLILSGGDTGVM